MSYREKQIILSYNKKRNAVAHGKPMLINRRDVVFYRYFVAEFTEKNRSAQFKHGSIQQLLFETVLKSILGAKSGKKGSSKTYLTAVRNGLLGIFILFSCGIIMITEMLSDVATFFSEDSLTNNTIENTTFEGTLSELSDESTQKTYITVIVIDTQVYDGPGDFYLIKDTVYAGQQFELIDHSWDQNWLEIQLNSTDRGWIRKDTTQ
ncbi:MAG: SH3 domain-containing protein [Chloroflexota bacterium]